MDSAASKLVIPMRHLKLFGYSNSFGWRKWVSCSQNQGDPRLCEKENGTHSLRRQVIGKLADC